ncbi:MAG: hypothetical protein LW707_08680 [Sphingobacteriales bacterium]|nr:hypothetical protein [Sphingobacteriales bacterium]
MEKPTLFRTVLLYCLMFGVVAAVLMLAWNQTMTDLFQFPELEREELKRKWEERCGKLNS